MGYETTCGVEGVVLHRTGCQDRTRPMAASAYGFWMSPVTSDFVVANSIRLEQVALDGDVLYWSETQPQKKGRSFVWRMAKSGGSEPVTPDDDNGFSVRTRVHEYGGGAFAVRRRLFLKRRGSATLSPGRPRAAAANHPTADRGRRQRPALC